MRVEGQIEVGEAAPYAGRACAPLRGGPNAFLALVALTLAIFGAAYALFTGADLLFGFPDEVALLAPYLLGLAAFLIAWNLTRNYALRRTRDAYGSRGLVSPFASAFELTPDSLTVVTGRLTAQAPWSAVSDLFPVGPYWVILMEGSAQFLPRRFFVSRVEEKTFIGVLIARMTQEARARSSEAVAFAAD